MKEKILALLEQKKYPEIAALVKDMNPADAAVLLEELPQQSMPLIFRLLPKELAADAFAYMDGDTQELLIQGFTDKELDEVMGEMFLDDTVDLIEEMPANVVKKILRHVDEETRKMINQVLNYPKDSAGAMMTMEYVDLKRSMTVEQAFDRIRATGLDSETIYTCYVTDSRRKLEGIVTVRELLLSPKNAVLRDIMETNVKFVSTHTDQEEAARLLSKYDFLALPVVDNENRMVGIVTFDDAMDVMEEEATEDIEIMGGMSPSEKTYSRATTWDLFKQRIPWLLLLMVSATFTGMIITGFENALAAQVALTAFIPMLMDTGGNSGSQSSVTVIRALSLGELEFRDLPQVIWKEIRTAVCCGTVLAAACFCKILLVDRLLMGNSSITVAVALVVCLTMAITVLLAKTVGCILPMSAKRLGFDPAVMASPFITTIVDALSLLVYFGIAKALLGV